MPGKRKIKKKREDAANKCKNKSLMGSLGKYPLFPHPPPLSSWCACPEAEVLDASTRTGATCRGGAMPTPPPLEPSRQSAEQSRRQQFTLVLVAPVWKSQLWYPILLEMLEDFPILLPHMEDLIIPTHPEGVPAVLPQLAAWLISGNASKAKKKILKRATCRAAVCIIETEVFKIL